MPHTLMIQVSSRLLGVKDPSEAYTVCHTGTYMECDAARARVAKCYKDDPLFTRWFIKNASGDTMDHSDSDEAREQRDKAFHGRLLT